MNYEIAKVQSSPISIDFNALNSILENTIASNPSVVVNKEVGNKETLIDKNILQTLEEDINKEPENNCLALTLKKDYSLSIAKNAFIKGIRMSFKVAVSTLFLNIARIFL